jgi:hypothetical protein
MNPDGFLPGGNLGLSQSRCPAGHAAGRGATAGPSTGDFASELPTAIMEFVEAAIKPVPYTQANSAKF